MQIHGMNSGSWATIWRTHRRRFLLHKIKKALCLNADTGTRIDIR